MKLMDLIASNIGRQKNLTADFRCYNPISGRGAYGNRIKIFDPGSCKFLYLKSEQLNASDFLASNPNKNRDRFDFEYWYSSNPDNHSLTSAQRSLIIKLESLRETLLSPRIIILHASRMGVSSLCKMYIYWLQFIVFSGSDSALFFPNIKIAQNEKHALYSSVKENPKRYLLENNSASCDSYSSISFNHGYQRSLYKSLYNPNSVRGFSPSFILFSNVNKTLLRDKCKLDKLALTYNAINPSCSNSMVIMESSSFGVHKGGFFNNTFRASANTKNNDEAFAIPYYSSSFGISSFKPIFLPWHAVSKNSLRLKVNIPSFWKSLSCYEYFLWNVVGCTLEQINWYRHKCKFLSDSKRAALFPSTLAESLNHTICFDKQDIPLLEYTDIGTKSNDFGEKMVSIAQRYVSVSQLLDVNELITPDDIHEKLTSNHHFFKLVKADSLGPPGYEGVLCRVMEAEHAC